MNNKFTNHLKKGQRVSSRLESEQVLLAPRDQCQAGITACVTEGL